MTPTSIAQALIRCRSESSASNAACAELLDQLLRQRGFDVARYDYRDLQGVPKVTLAAMRPGHQPTDRGIAFLSHSDVVSAEGWRTPHGAGPWDAVEQAGRVWGRGACDMKGPVASALAAIDAMESSSQAAPIYFFVTGDEECGMLGAQLLFQQCPIYRRMVSAQSLGVITEPTSLRVVNSHKGGCKFRVIAHGVAAHSSTSDGLNANWQLIAWLNELREVVKRAESDPRLQNQAFQPPTLNINVILRNQPSEFNITVSQASCELFMRTMPDTQWQLLVEELTRSARDMELEVSAITSLPPLATPADRPFVREALRIVDQAQPDAMGYATDGCRYTDLVDLIVLGPGSIDQAHRCDEWIAVEQLERGASIYQRLIERYAGQAIAGE